MSNINFSGSDEQGVANFYTQTNRFTAREWEDNKALSFINSESGQIFSEKSYAHTGCPFCNSEKVTYIFKKQNYFHWRCESCNFLFVNPSLRQDIINNEVYGTTEYPFFDSVNSDNQKKFDFKRFSSVIELLEKSLLKTESIYDGGCGSGYFLSLLKEKGFTNLYGSDVLLRAVNYAHSVYGLSKVAYADLYNDITSNTNEFSAITLWELLDHVVEPIKYLEACLRKLKKGGYLIISVRNGYSLAARIMQEHCNMFLGYAHTNFWSEPHFKTLENKYLLDLLDLKTYISERDAVINYLNFKSPYNSSSENLDFIPDQDYILNNNLGYKFIGVFQKK